MQWRNIDYSVVQAAGKPVWKWKIDIAHRSIATHGEARSRPLAITAAIMAIEKLAANQLRHSIQTQATSCPAESEEHANV